jgi:hypothetical protein
MRPNLVIPELGVTVLPDNSKHPVGFPLRLAASLRERAKAFAAQDGVSLNHFINLAVAEKVSRLETAPEGQVPPVSARKTRDTNRGSQKRL